jgi:hypothetical protein
VASLAIGLGLAAFYIVPAAWEQKWVDISLALTLPHNRPENNFIRLFPPRLPGGITSIVTVGAVNLALVAVVFLLAIRRRNELPREWRAFAVLAAFAAVFTIPPSLIFWKLLPKMIFVQLPWRWLFVVNTAGAFLLAAILPTVSTRTKRIAIALPTLVLLALLATYATKGKPGQVAELQEKLESYGGYWAEAMYLPRGEVRGPAPDRSLVNGDNVAIESLRREGEKVVFRSNAQRPARLQLALSWFPAWRVKVNGNSAPAIDDGGQVAVDVPAGTSNVEIDFVRTPDRRLGNALSLCTLALLALAVASRIVWRRTVRQE